MSATENIPGHALAPELQELQRQFAALKTGASELVNGLKESQFNWRPDSQSWSMAECLLHLNMTGERCVGLIEKALADARARRPAGPQRLGYGPWGKWLLGRTEPPPKRRSKSARSLTPAYGQPITAVLPTFLHIQDQLADQVAQAGGLDLRRVKLPLPGFGPIRPNLHLAFAWIAAHERRHLWQARQVRRHAAFPPAQSGRVA
jgi:hypothetical protein